MSELTVIEAPMVNVNDSSIMIVTHEVQDGAQVEAEDVIYTAETSKMTFTIPSPVRGFVRLLIPEGEDVDIGEPIAYVAESPEQLPPKVDEKQVPQAGKPGTAATDQRPLSPGSNIHAIGLPDSISNGTLTHWLVPDETTVAENQALFSIRAEGASHEITAPFAGIVKFLATPPAFIHGEEVVCVIGNSATLLSDFANKHSKRKSKKADQEVQPSTLAGMQDTSRFSHKSRPHADGPVVLSKKAQKLVEEAGIETSALPFTGLVRERDILAYLNPSSDSGKGKKEDAQSAQLAALGTVQAPIDAPHATSKLPKAKRFEAQMLSNTYRMIVPSQVSVLVPTRGVFELCRSAPLLNGAMASRILFEISRLSKKYPFVNATYQDGNLVQYTECNIGYALDAEGRGLKVPIIHKADQLSLPEIHHTKQDLMARYFENSLTAEDLIGGTFTVTDLSGTGSWSFNPVLNANQSAILGIGDEQGVGDGRMYYPLVLAFDHRVTEGLYATRFLTDLKERLIAHEESLFEEHRGTASSNTGVRCSVCLREYDEIKRDGNHLFKAVGDQGTEKLICSTCLEGW